jgi:hypothetical protein
MPHSYNPGLSLDQPSWYTDANWLLAQQAGTGGFYNPSGYTGYAPVEQYQQYLSEVAPDAGYSPIMEQARMSRLSPLYAQYQALGWLGSESFGDYLSVASPEQIHGTPSTDDTSYADMVARASQLAYAGPLQREDDPSFYPYYKDEQAQEAQMRLARQLELGPMGGAQYNPTVQRAVGSVMDRMYQRYLGTDAAKGGLGPQGFLKYYMQQRHPGSIGTEYPYSPTAHVWDHHEE